MPTLARLATISPTVVVMERFGDTPPDTLPDGATKFAWVASPCLHALSNVEVRDAMAAAGWGDDTVADLCAPIRRIAA